MVWSLAAIGLLGYIVIVHGHKVEILTLILGIIGGTIIGGVFGTYFGGNHKEKPIPDDPPTEVTVTNKPNEPIPVEQQ